MDKTNKIWNKRCLEFCQNYFGSLLSRKFQPKFYPKMGPFGFLNNQKLRWNYFVNWWEIYITRNLLHTPTKIKTG